MSREAKIFEENSRESLRNTILSNLESLRREWSEETPPRIVNGKDLEYKNSKYRKNWFASAIGFCALALDKGLLSDEVGERVFELEKKLTSKEFKGSLSTKEDILELNRLIDDVIEELSREDKSI